MWRKKIVQWNGQTGEVLDGFFAYVPPRRVNGFGERWCAMAQLAGEFFAKSDLGLEGHRVLWMLFTRLDFENHLVLNQAEIGRELGMHRQSVQQAIKRLIHMGVLLEGPKHGQIRSYRLNPELVWKGSAKNHVKALDEHRKQRRKAAQITGVVEGGKPEEEEEGREGL